MIRYPKNIKKGDIIGVTATSTGITEESYIKRLENAYKNLKELGYNCIETSNVRKNKKFVSSDGKTRAEEFMNLWQDEKISWIAQVYGGEFLMEMIPYIDIDIMKNSEPKWTTGFSDSSLLNFFLTTNFNIATATTDSILHFGMENLYKSLINQINILQNGGKSLQESFELYEKEKFPRDERIYTPYNLTDKVEYKHLYNKDIDIIKGRLIGGCIDVIYHLLGTPYDNTVNFCSQFNDGMLWYLENCEQPVTNLYRILWQMKQSGWFKNAKGFIIGRTRVNATIGEFEYTDALHNIFDDMNVPVVYDVDFGHVAPQWTMINGSYAEFKYDNGKGYIMQDMI